MNSSAPEDWELADEIGRAASRPLSPTDAASGSAPCSDSPVQRIGRFSIPVQGWSLLQVDPPDGVILWVGVVQLRVVAAGKWTPEEPERYLRNPIEPPQPQPHESHQSYAQRFMEWSQPCRSNPEWLRWNGRKVWTGQTVDQLRDLLESDQSVPNNCFLINPNPK